MTIKITSAGASARCFASRLQFCKMKFHSRTPCSRVHEEGQRCGRRWPSFCLDGRRSFETLRSRTDADHVARLPREHREGRVAPLSSATMQKWLTRKRPVRSRKLPFLSSSTPPLFKGFKGRPCSRVAAVYITTQVAVKYASIRVVVKLVMLRMNFRLLTLDIGEFDYEI